MNILIADDDRVISAAIAARLKAAGYGTLVAFDAMQALMMVARNSPDAVVLDVGMPGGSGVHTLERLKASSKTAHIPVIVLTGSSDAALPAKVRALGAAEFLTKPVDYEKLEATLARLTRRPTQAPPGKETGSGS
jgi:DNA-binding response OmpR family regulator